MSRILHIVTRDNDPLAQEVIRQHQFQPELRIEIADLTVESTDYRELLEKIFAADSVAVW